LLLIFTFISGSFSHCPVILLISRRYKCSNSANASAANSDEKIPSKENKTKYLKNKNRKIKKIEKLKKINI
jgi:hypothetical protein